MTVKELKEKLARYNDDAEVKVFNDFEESTYLIDDVTKELIYLEGKLVETNVILIIDKQF